MTDHNEILEAASDMSNHVKNEFREAESELINHVKNELCDAASDMIKKGTNKLCDAGSNFIKNVTNKQTNENDFNNNQIRFIKMSNGLLGLLVFSTFVNTTSI